MTDLDQKTKLKAAHAKLNGVKGLITADTGIYVAVPVKTRAKTEVLYFRSGTDATQHTNLPRKPRVKKGCGQRKNKRDKAGRARHVQLLPYGHHPQVAVAS